MSFLDHLEELRDRLLKSVVAIAVGMAACLTYVTSLILFLNGPAEAAAVRLVPIDATEIFSIYFRVGLTGGLCLAAPVVLWQAWRFIEPGLHRHEKWYAGPFLLSTTVCFAAGAGFGYQVVLPWFLKLQAAMATAVHYDNTMSALSYFGLLTTMIVTMGLIFEMPPVVFILSRIGLVNARFLLRNFKYAILAFAVAAAVLTPSTTDIVPMMAFMAVMIAVYLVSVVVAAIFGRSRRID
jgi:sec-independent protein translocase protein TatC